MKAKTEKGSLLLSYSSNEVGHTDGVEGRRRHLFGSWCCPKAAFAATSLYPHRGEAQFARRDDVVVLALGRVKDVFLLYARRGKLIENILKHPRARLIYPHLIAGDPLLKRISHVRAHVLQRPRIGVRHGHEPVPQSELLERLHRIGKRRPRPDGVPKTFGVVLERPDVPAGCHIAVDEGKHLGKRLLRGLPLVPVL